MLSNALAMHVYPYVHPSSPCISNKFIKQEVLNPFALRFSIDTVTFMKWYM